MSIGLRSLGYLGFGGQNLDAWRRLSMRVLGTEARARVSPEFGEVLGLRMDEFVHRFILCADRKEREPFFGFDVENSSAMGALRETFGQRGIAANDATEEELELRQVQEMVWMRDPDGNRLEFYRDLATASEPFAPDRPMGGFVTGSMGVGHVVFVVEQLERAEAFYQDKLGFRVSDYVLEPTRRAFLRINARHHTVALAERPGGGIAHIMVEVRELDDVGRAYDVALADYSGDITSTLGRHSNDHMTSFYLQTPAGVPIEYGWGGRSVDEDTWKVAQLFGPSLWGHDRIASPPEARAAANAQREYAYTHGLRAPLAAHLTGDDGE